MGKKVTGADGVEFDLDEAINNALSNANPDSKKDTAVQTIVGQLMTDNFEYRRKLGEMKSKVEPLEKEGVKVLSKEEAAAYEQYLALGKPEDLKTTVEGYTTLKTELEQTKFDNTISTAAEVNGYKKNILRDIVKANGLNVIVKDHEFSENGKTVTKQAAFVVDSTTKGEKLLPDVLKEKFSDYLPALATNTDSGGRGWIHQVGTPDKGGQGQKSIFDSFKQLAYDQPMSQAAERSKGS